MLSSSAGREPELVLSGSASSPEPGWATEEARLCLPLLPCSSSGAPLLGPLIEGRLRRCVKLLLYRLDEDGRGEPRTGISVGCGGPPRKEAGIPAVREVRCRGCIGGNAEIRLWAEAGDSGSRDRGTGEAESEPALKGWKEIDGRLPEPSARRLDGTRFPIGNECGSSKSECLGREAGGELVSEPGGFTDRSAEMGLVPRGPSPWKVDRLP